MQLRVDQNSLHIPVVIQQSVCLGKSLPRKEKQKHFVLCVCSLFKTKWDFFFSCSNFLCKLFWASKFGGVGVETLLKEFSFFPRVSVWILNSFEFKNVICVLVPVS